QSEEARLVLDIDVPAVHVAIEVGPDLGAGEVVLSRLHDDAGGADLAHQLDHAARDLGEPDVQIARRPQGPLAGRGGAGLMLDPLHGVPPDLAICTPLQAGECTSQAVS